MSVHVKTGNMLDVVVEGKSIGLKQPNSDHRKYEVIWLPNPLGLVEVLQREISRLAGEQSTGDLVSREAAVRGIEAEESPDYDYDLMESGWEDAKIRFTELVSALPAKGKE
jgi:hypothetical protein